MGTASKQCRGCGETKGLGEFGRDAKYRDGLRTLCRPCENADRRRRIATKRLRRVGGLTADLDAERLSEAVLGVFRDVYRSSPGALRADLAATLQAVDPGERLLALLALSACRAAAQAVVRRYDWQGDGSGI